MKIIEIIIYSALWFFFIIISIIGGSVLKLYDKTKWFDLVIHFFGGALIFSTSFTLLYNVAKLSPNISLPFAFCITLSAGVLWEFCEFFLDKLFNTNHQRWKDSYNSGLIDTMTDQIAGTIGALLACIVWLIIVV